MRGWYRRRWLGLQVQRGFAGGAVVEQLDGTDALGLAAVLEEDQARLGKGAIAFEEGGFLDALGHGALDLYRDLDRGRRGVVLLAPSTAAATAHAGFRLGG